MGVIWFLDSQNEPECTRWCEENTAEIDGRLLVGEMGSSGAGPLQGQEEPMRYRQEKPKSTGPSRLRVNKSGCATWERRPLQKAAATKARKASGLKA